MNWKDIVSIMDKILVVVAVTLLGMYALYRLPPEMSARLIENMVAGLFGLATGMAISNTLSGGTKT